MVSSTGHSQAMSRWDWPKTVYSGAVEPLRHWRRGRKCRRAASETLRVIASMGSSKSASRVKRFSPWVIFMARRLFSGRRLTRLYSV